MMPKILIINRVYPPDRGASGLRVRELKQGLEEYGWQVEILSASTHLNFGSFPSVPFWQYIFVWVGLFLKGLFIKDVRVIISCTDPPLLNLMGVVLGWLKKAKTVHWSMDVYPELFCLQGDPLPNLALFLFKKLDQWALNKTHEIVTLGQDMQEVMSKKTHTQIRVIPNWPDPDMDKSMLTHDIWQLDKIKMLYSGNIGLAHDLDLFIEALSCLNQERVQVVINATGRGLASLKQKVLAKNIRCIQFCAPPKDNSFWGILMGADMHVATMSKKSYGLLAPSKINTALGLGKPVLFFGPKKTHFEKLITQFMAGLCVDFEDRAAALAVATYIDELSQQDLRKMSEGALKSAESISYSQAMREYDSMLKKLINL